MMINSTDNFTGFKYQLYLWSLEQMNEEIDSNLDTLRSMKNPYTLTEVHNLENFPKSQQRFILQASIKQRYAKILPHLKEFYLSDEEENLLNIFNRDFSRIRRSTTGTANLFLENPNKLYLEFDKKRLYDSILDSFSAFFNDKPKRFGNDLRYSIKLEKILLTVDVSIEKGNYSYGNQIYDCTENSNLSQLFSGPIYFPRYLGIIHGSTWCFDDEIDIDNASSTIASQCNKFIRFVVDYAARE